MSKYVIKKMPNYIVTETDIKCQGTEVIESFLAGHCHISTNSINSVVEGH